MYLSNDLYLFKYERFNTFVGIEPEWIKLEEPQPTLFKEPYVRGSLNLAGLTKGQFEFVIGELSRVQSKTELYQLLVEQEGFTYEVDYTAYRKGSRIYKKENLIIEDFTKRRGKTLSLVINGHELDHFRYRDIDI